MALKVNVTKATQRQSLSLNTSKAETVTVFLNWSGSADLDLHALFACQTPNGAKVTDFDEILSTYNVIRKVRENGQMVEVGTLPLNPDGTFGIFNGALLHSKDALNGDAGTDDEWIKINPSLFPARSAPIEIPLVAMIHNQPPNNKTFADITDAAVKVVSSTGNVLLDVSLTGQEFAGYNGVQLGAFTIDPNNGSLVFVTQVSVFKGEFNAVLEVYS
jgi:tellurium resistance protein TerD